MTPTVAAAAPLYRCIALNPVRAGICSNPAEWRWSSYPMALGVIPRLPFLSDEELLDHFAGDPRRARKALRAFVKDGLRTPSP